MEVPVAPGTHRVIVRKYGFPDFERTVTLTRDQVLPLTVVLQEAQPRVVSSGERGTIVQDTVRVSIMHLSPAVVPIEYQGRRLGETPAIAWLPVGDINLLIGGAPVCLRVSLGAPGDTTTHLVRLRAGQVEAMRGLRPCSQGGLQIGQDSSEALVNGVRYKRGCDSGDAAGCDSLGLLYENRPSQGHNYERASQLYRRACDGRNADGCLNLGMLFENGHGVPIGLPQALALYRSACSLGSSDGRPCDDWKAVGFPRNPSHPATLQAR